MLLNTNYISIFEEFLRDLSKSITGSEIAKLKNLNQKTVSNILNNLELASLLKSKIQGKNKLYKLNLNNKEILANYIFAVEHLRTIEFYKQNLLIKEVSEKIKPLVNGSAIIFGSFAKNTQKKGSDLDILIIGTCKETKINNLSKIYNLDISLKIYNKFKIDHLITEVIKNHIIIKGVEKYYEEQLNEQNNLV